VALEIRVQEFPGSNLTAKADFLRKIYGSPHSLQTNSGISPKINYSLIELSLGDM
jgi:hypothetical protein